MFSKPFLSCLIGLATALLASYCLAKNINLYDQPKADAKIIGTIDPSKGIVPIFSPKQSEWVKIGDPHNGNVGWVKSSELASAGNTSSGYSFSQEMTTQGNQPKSMIMQFGQLPQLTPEQTDSIYKQAQEQSAIIQSRMLRMMQDIYNGGNMPMPVIMPIVVMPQQMNTPTQNTNAPPAATQKNK